MKIEGTPQERVEDAEAPAPIGGSVTHEELANCLENLTMALELVGKDGTVLWANRTTLNQLGYRPQEYIGRNIRDFYIDEQVTADITRRLNEGEEFFDYEASVRAKDGSIRQVAIDSNVTCEKGRFLHTRNLNGVGMDQNPAAEVQERLAAIVESSDDAIVSKDLNGIIRSWNRGAERIFGYTAEEVIGHPISILTVPERRDEIPRILDRIRLGQRVDHYETKRRTKDGRVLTVSLTVSPIRDASGTIIGASKVARDITERVEAEEMLRQTNRALSRANADLEQFA